MRLFIAQTFLISIGVLLSSAVIQAQNIRNEQQFSEHKSLPFYNLKKVNNTAIFQGNKKKKNYFEGWYFKMVAPDGKSIISIIPGISISEDGKEQHAFIQMINGVTATTRYFSFPIESFSFSKKEFAIKIGDNYFSENLLTLDLVDDSLKIKGKVTMENTVNYSSGRLFNHSIMGWYRFVPKMECYHGVVSLNHDLTGTLTINEKQHDFSEGKGYIEKDWGSSMPASWIWLQSNNFTTENSSFMLSIANVPWRKKSFNGFLGFFYWDAEVYRFATYKNTKINLEVLDENTLSITIKNKKHSFLIAAKRNNMGMLKAPKAGSMDRRIPESVDAQIKITVFDKKGIKIHQDSTTIAGMELVDDFWQLAGEIK